MRQKLHTALAFLYTVVLIETLWLGLMLLVTLSARFVLLMAAYVAGGYG